MWVWGERGWGKGTNWRWTPRQFLREGFGWGGELHGVHYTGALPHCMAMGRPPTSTLSYGGGCSGARMSMSMSAPSRPCNQCGAARVHPPPAFCSSSHQLYGVVGNAINMMSALLGVGC